MIPADRTVVHDDIPGPEGHSLDLDASKVSRTQRHANNRPSTFFTSNRFLPSSFLLAESAGFLPVDGPGASVMSTSAMAWNVSFGSRVFCSGAVRVDRKERAGGMLQLLYMNV